MTCDSYEPASRVSTNCRHCGGSPGDHVRKNKLHDLLAATARGGPITDEAVAEAVSAALATRQACCLDDDRDFKLVANTVTAVVREILRIDRLDRRSTKDQDRGTKEISHG